MANETRAQLHNKSLILSRKLTHLCRVDSSTLCLDQSISNRRGALFVFIGTMLSRNSGLLCKQCRHYQMPHSVTSNLGQHYLPMFVLWDARH